MDELEREAVHALIRETLGGGVRNRHGVISFSGTYIDTLERVIELSDYDNAAAFAPINAVPREWVLTDSSVRPPAEGE